MKGLGFMFQGMVFRFRGSFSRGFVWRIQGSGELHDVHRRPR